MRRVLGWTGTALGILLLSALLVEIALQVASRFTDEDPGAWRPGSRVRILAVGDSHTYGAFVEPDAAYPAQLEAQLEARTPGAYSVINRGVPGMNTSQVRNRLPVWLSRYGADVVVVWAGINNSWNTAETGGAATSWLGWLEAQATRSRLYRAVRVWIHDRALERVVASGADPAWQVVEVEGALGAKERWSVRTDGRQEEILHERRPEESADAAEVSRELERDYAAMVAQVRAAGAELIFITYPYDADWFAVANRALRSVAERTGVAVVDSSESVRRLPREQQQLTWAAHPTAPMYREIARDVALHIKSGARPSDE